MHAWHIMINFTQVDWLVTEKSGWMDKDTA
uniref:Uncharacterized protein n=1 Tax=Arundo donax TaxID=35708 RepID=A0A0A9BSE9_ARUDO